MGELLSFDEIEKRYDSEWVLIGDPETDEKLNILRGRVLCHSPDRDEVDRKDKELRPRSAAILYIGSPPPDMIFAL